MLVRNDEVRNLTRKSC